ncbi:hypothetical protein FH972_019525 [Carpinus fangiana]|uniref:TF-B3 domain-containing protein n=1 Tax=Carpinus fangiana TaxID=176857 RepID=A0A5N6RTN8_9ROSI|nr:hypothetical protein FH972_019525 [Carpinus fangiana]
MAAPVTGDFDCEEVYKRQLTANDIKERSRLYINKSAALKFCPEAFDHPLEDQTYRMDLRFCDTSFNPMPMAFLRRDKKSYLIGGWRDFVEANQLGPGDIIRIHVLEHKRNGVRFFMIGRVQVMGILIG